jgi:hypothetical protein
LYLYEVAGILAKEFNCDAPSDASLSRWFADAQSAYLADIKSFRSARTMALLEQNDRLRRKYMPIAIADELAITRYRNEDGETVAFTDENSYSEQVKAAEVVIRCAMVEMELLGLKGGGGIIEKKDDGQSMGDLFAYIGKLAANNVAAGKVPGPITEGAPVLELRSGFEDVYKQVISDPQ